jgi:hypothetical protein
MKRRGAVSGAGHKKASRNKGSERHKAAEAFEGDAHAFLRSIYRNPSVPLGLRLDAAKAAIPFENSALFFATSSASWDADATASAWLDDSCRRDN